MVFSWSPTFTSTSNVKVFEIKGDGKNSSDHLGPRMLHRRFVVQVWLSKSYPSNNPILLRFIPLFGYVRTRDLILIFSDKTRPLRWPACTYFVTAYHWTLRKGNTLARLERGHLCRWELSCLLSFLRFRTRSLFSSRIGHYCPASRWCGFSCTVPICTPYSAPEYKFILPCLLPYRNFGLTLTPHLDTLLRFNNVFP